MKSISLWGLVFATALLACTSTKPATTDSDLGDRLFDGSVEDAAITSDLALAPVDLQGAIDYSSAGPQAFTTEMASASLTNTTVPLTLYVPSGPGPFPVVVLSPGFQQGRAGYAPYGERLASHGILTIMRDDPGFLSNSITTAAQLTELVATWLPAEHAKPSGLLAGKIALDKAGLIGHSRGGQASILAATGGLKGKLKGLFGLDPVDTQMGVGTGDQARVALPTIGIPTAFLGETLDGTPPPFSFQACAPLADNYAVLYAAAPAPSLLLTAEGASHFDFELASAATGASFCQNGAADGAAVLEMSVTLATGFFARELQGAPVGAGLEGAGASGFVQSGRLTRSQK